MPHPMRGIKKSQKTGQLVPIPRTQGQIEWLNSANYMAPRLLTSHAHRPPCSPGERPWHSNYLRTLVAPTAI